MKLLLDENLSRRLVPRLQDAFPETAHVAGLGLESAPDERVWNYARDNGYVLVTKDNDFLALALRFGRPPLVVWLRDGNGPSSLVEVRLRSSVPVIAAAFAEPTARIVELR